MMTPGLREFVLEAPARDPGNAPKSDKKNDPGKDPPNSVQDPLPAALAALAQAFTVVGEPGAPGSGVRRRTWLDTFDWRLYRAGLMLEVEQASRTGRLLLTKTAPTPPAHSTPPAPPPPHLPPRPRPPPPRQPPLPSRPNSPSPAGRPDVPPRTCPPARSGTRSRR